ncbi:hypothetical protein, partial [Actinocorallia lasiicapitis]
AATALPGGASLRASGGRPSRAEKARLVAAAGREIVDLGLSLNTCAGYLSAGERPADYRDAVLAFLRRGGAYRCVLLDPACEDAALWSRLTGEDLPARINDSLARFARFKSVHSVHGFEVFQTGEAPGMWALCTDPGTSRALTLYSPYLPRADRADLPHYLAGPAHPALSAAFARAMTPTRLRRVL